MKIFKKGLCLVLAMLILVMGMPFGALATTDGTDSGTSAVTSPVILQLDTPETAVIETVHSYASFHFTPSESGYYEFYSMSYFLIFGNSKP